MRKRLWLRSVFLVSAMAVATTTAPVEAAPSQPAVPEIPFERYELDNGLEVILHQDKRVPLVAVDVWYHVGSGNEVPGKSGFAHLFEHMMFQGAKHIGEDVHFDVLKQIGATGINGTTNHNRTNYFETVPKNQLETALWLESDRMGYLLDLLNEKSLANQRDVVRNERRQRVDNVAYGQERLALAEELYPEGHPYRYLVIGRHEDLESASLEDVRAFFRKWYVPSNATLLLAGDFETKHAKQVIEKWFGSFPAIAKPERTTVDTPVLAKTVRREIEDPFARLERLHYVWHSPAAYADGDAELSILGSVLGAGGWGRLYKLLVVEKQLAQRARAYQSGSGHSGEFHIVVDLKPGKDRAEAEKLVQQELAKVLAEPVTAAEVRRAVISRESGLIWSLEELMSRAERLQSFNHYVDDPGYTAKYIETYRTRTPAQILDFAQKTLSKPRIEMLTNPKPGKGKGEGKGEGKRKGKGMRAKEGSK